MTVPAIVDQMIQWARERKGQQYDWLNLITFGLLRLPNARICSRFIFNAVRVPTQFLANAVAFILSPEGQHDGLPTPNDLINSRKMIRVRYKGEISKA
jgi:hypothetical protein